LFGRVPRVCSGLYTESLPLGQQPERESFGRRDEPEPGPMACSEFVTTLSLGAAEEPAGAESFSRRDEPEPGPSACSGVESTWSSSSSSRRVLRASAGVRVVRRTRDRLPGRGKRTSDRHPRSSSGDPFSCIAFVPCKCLIV